MKKLFSLITILSFLMQVIPFEVKAQPVYDDAFDSGDVYFVGNTTYHYLDASNSYSTVSSPMNISGMTAVYDTNGDLIFANGPYVYCLSKVSNFLDVCRPYDLSNVPTSALYNTSPTSGGIYRIVIDQFNNVWAMVNSPTEDKIFRVYKQSTGYYTHDVINISDTTTDLQAIMVDMLGDVWVIKNDTDVTTDTYIYCLDHRNSYAPCSGGSFDGSGRINLGYGRLQDLTIDSNNDIFVISGYDNPNDDNRIIKLDRDTYFGSTFTQTSVQGTALTTDLTIPQTITVDGQNRLWIAGSNSGNTQVNISCFNSTNLGVTGVNPGECGASEVTKLIATTPFVAPKVMVDLNNDLWFLNMTGATVLCYDSAASYGSCGSYAISDTFSPLTNRGDQTGFFLNRLMDANAGQDQAQITATVDPVISFEIRNAADNAALTNNVCSLGTLSTSSTSTCEYRLAIETNATSGFTVYYDANGGLISGSDEIDAVGESTVSTGVEEYGVAFSDATGTVSPQGNFTSDDSSVPNTSTLVVASSGPYDYQVGSLGTSTLVTHKASISPITPAGSYSQVVTITVTGNF